MTQLGFGIFDWRPDESSFFQSEADTSVGAHIVSVIDGFDVMVSSRLHREAQPVDKAIRRLHESTEKQFGPASRSRRCLPRLMQQPSRSQKLRFARLAAGHLLNEVQEELTIFSLHLSQEFSQLL